MATWAELETLVRDQLSDPGATTWSQPKLVRYFAEAQEKACRWGYLLRENKTVTMTAGTLEYDFPASTIYILRIKWGGRSRPLDPHTTDFLDRKVPGWDDGTRSGGPESWVTDQDTKKFRIYRTPDASAITKSDKLTCLCVVMPSARPTVAEFQDNTTTPEIEEENHYELIDYVLFRAHNEDDHADGRKKAKDDLAMFRANMEMAKRERIQQTWGETTPWPKVV